MATQTRPARHQATQQLLIVLVAVCVLLIILNVSMALRQNGSAASPVAADVYTLETHTP